MHRYVSRHSNSKNVMFELVHVDCFCLTMCGCCNTCALIFYHLRSRVLLGSRPIETSLTSFGVGPAHEIQLNSKQNLFIRKQQFWIPINTFLITFILLAIKHFLIAVSIVLLSNLLFDCSVESFALKPILFDCIIKTQIDLHTIPQCIML